MGYYIYAWFEDGIPQLQIVDANSGSVCISWKYHNDDLLEINDKKQMQKLFKDLLLLTCKQEINNFRVFKSEPIQDSYNVLK